MGAGLLALSRLVATWSLSGLLPLATIGLLGYGLSRLSRLPTRLSRLLPLSVRFAARRLSGLLPLAFGRLLGERLPGLFTRLTRSRLLPRLIGGLLARLIVFRSALWRGSPLTGVG